MKSNYLENPPALKINGVLYKDHSMPVHVRLEQRIVWNLLKVLAGKGFEVVGVHDGEEYTRVASRKAAAELIFNLDDCHVYFTFETHEKAGGNLRKVWIRLVMGNELDVISDYNASNWHGFEDIVSKFDPEVYA
jgi:hypothetical protein